MKTDPNLIQENSTMRLVYTAVLLALSVVGAFINIPGTSIAFDSMPGFFAALFLGPGVGALVAGFGHIMTASLRGFYLTLPLHIIISFEMAACAYIFARIYRKFNGVVASITAVVLNGPVSLIIIVLSSFLIGLENGGWVLFTSLIIPLTVVSAINVILAYLVYKIIKRSNTLI